MSKHPYPKAVRLRRRREYLRVQRTGQRTHTESFVFVRQKGLSRETRLGVTVSSKVGNAVARNRIKRRVRELFRSNRNELEPGLDIVVIAKRGADGLTFNEIARELLPVFAATA